MNIKEPELFQFATGASINIQSYLEKENVLEALLTKNVTLDIVKDFWGEIEEEVSEEEIIDQFMDSEDYIEYLYSKMPMINYGYILQCNVIPQKDLDLVQELTSINVFYLDDLDVNVLTLTCCGMDMSDELELAYLIIDEVSPITASQSNPILDEYRKKNTQSISKLT
jgi:hypothetical protein